MAEIDEIASIVLPNQLFEKSGKCDNPSIEESIGCFKDICKIFNKKTWF